MTPDLLEILADPYSREPLVLENAEMSGAHIVSGSLHEPRSARQYPIVRGIPRFVQDGYADSFGLQWSRYARTQLDSSTGCGRSRQRLLTEVPWLMSMGSGAWVLDAGCGAGRFAEIASTTTARLVALDMSRAVDAASTTIAGAEGVNFVQGDLLQPPFRHGVFDGVYSLGVLQHTPDPLRAARVLLSLVGSGGSFAFTIYGRRPLTFLYGKYVLRTLTRRLPPARLLAAIEAAMPVLFPLTDILFRIPVLGKLFQFAIPVANYVENTCFTRQQRYEEAVLDTFDMLAPTHDHPVALSGMERLLSQPPVTEWRFLTRVPVVVNGTCARLG